MIQRLIMIYNSHDSTTTRVCKLEFGKTTSFKSFHLALQKLSVVSPQATANQIESILLTVCLQRHSMVTHSWESQKKTIPIKHFYFENKSSANTTVYISTSLFCSSNRLFVFMFLGAPTKQTKWDICEQSNAYTVQVNWLKTKLRIMWRPST